jgi:large subunit ribosomal protein L21
MYAIIKTGGKQYRVQQGESLLVERLTAADGDTVQLRPLLLVDGTEVIDGDGLADVTVEARVVAHERGPKLRIVKFKPKRGYKRRTGHRQELTRIEVTSMGKPSSRRSRSSAAKAKEPAPVAAGEAPEAGSSASEAPAEAAAKPATKRASTSKRQSSKPEATDGS